MIFKKSFALFAELEANNNKAWFDKHRDEIHEYAVAPLTATLEAATAALASTKVPMIGGAATLFRINRDIRFAKNKAPYKTSVSGLMTPDGTKCGDEGVVYLQLDERGGHMSAGYYNVEPLVLKRIRDKIVERPDKFRKVIKGLQKAGFDLVRESPLTGMPRGYSPYAIEWFSEYLKLKSFLVRTRLSKEIWINGTIVRHLIDHTIKCSSLIRFGQSK